MANREIGILGSGDVGRALGRGFASHGWTVTMGSRTPATLEDWQESVEGSVTLGSFEHAAAFGPVAVLAVDGGAVDSVLDLAGHDSFQNTIVLDTTNPLVYPEDGQPELAFGGTDSLGERVQDTLSDARVVKCFNTVSHEQMVDPEFEGQTPPMLICGDEPDAKARTQEILVDLGWPGTFNVGGIEAARYLEALVPLWIRLGAILKTRNHAFTVVE
jgi:hypothetical protein